MRRFRITDDDGQVYNIEETSAIEELDNTIRAISNGGYSNNYHDSYENEYQDYSRNDCRDEGLTEEEIAALKKLAGFADQLVNLIETKKDEQSSELTDEDEVIEDSDEDEDEDKRKYDSRRSFGSKLKIDSKINDADEKELAIAKAWAKRYEKFKNGGNA